MASTASVSSTEEDCDTCGVKYIGSKAKLIGFIKNAIPAELTNRLRDGTDIPTIIDVFTGTTRVAQAFRKDGWNVITSDLTWASDTYASLFTMLSAEDLAMIDDKLRILQTLPGVDGWVTTNYCDVPSAKAGGERVKMWQPKNGSRCDAIRDKIDEWEKSGEISHTIAMALTAILILGMDAVDSSVGVQQAYLKDWATRSFNDLRLRIPDICKELVGNPVGKHIVGDCLKIDYPSADIAYVDPPYTTHSYSTYYHIWDSISRWDKPEVGLVTNRRVDRIAKHGDFDAEMKSPWNSKKTAKQAFETLISRLPVRWVLISYSNESLIPITDIIAIGEGYRSVTTQEIDYTRNIMSVIGHGKPTNSRKNIEFLVLIEK
jgi:adenine-specific DNA-methyltransferase